MNVKELVDLLERAAQHSTPLQDELRNAIGSLKVGELELVFFNSETKEQVSWPIRQLVSSGTPVDSNSGEDLELWTHEEEALPDPLELGEIVATPAAIAAMEQAGQTADPFLSRHANGDWGDLSDEDLKSNDAAVLDGGRVMSVYSLNTGVKIWVITESDRSVTTLLLPEDY